MNADLERVGDLAVNIAEAGQRYIAHPPVKPLIDLPRMGALALNVIFIVEARDVRHRSSGLPVIERRRSGGAVPV